MQRLPLLKIKSICSCIFFSILAGLFSALIITAFKIAAEKIIHLSAGIYNLVRENPIWLPLLLSLAGIIGFFASFIVSKFESCRGGGIPTSVAAIRGLFSFRWLSSVIILPFSALITFFVGVPLGTEGPCVQMGTAIGYGVVKSIAPKMQSEWRRYIMSGGASAGFSIATASPISAIFFSFEELNKGFSPLLAISTVSSVLSAQLTARLLMLIGISTDRLFVLPEIEALPFRLLFLPLILGIVCGLISIFFTKFYHLVNKLVKKICKLISVKIIFLIIFVNASLSGFLLPDLLGTGHSLTEKLLNSNLVWYILLLIFVVRCSFTLFSNSAGVTGGIFLPTIVFGAIIGSLFAKAMISMGIIPANYYMLIVVLGIVAFLGATSRIPITACIFAIEALSCSQNIISIVIAVAAAYSIIKLSKLEDFTDTVINSKLQSIHNNT